MPTLFLACLIYLYNPKSRISPSPTGCCPDSAQFCLKDQLDYVESRTLYNCCGLRSSHHASCTAATFSCIQFVAMWLELVTLRLREQRLDLPPMGCTNSCKSRNHHLLRVHGFPKSSYTTLLLGRFPRGQQSVIAGDPSLGYCDLQRYYLYLTCSGLLHEISLHFHMTLGSPMLQLKRYHCTICTRATFSPKQFPRVGLNPRSFISSQGNQCCSQRSAHRASCTKATFSFKQCVLSWLEPVTLVLQEKCLDLPAKGVHKFS